MKSTGEWGEFFPHELSPFGYNETVAQEYFPLNEAQAKDLKAYIKSTSIKLGKVSGSSKKAKKIKMPKLKAIKVKYSKLKIKIPKPKKYKSLLSKGRSNKYFK